MYLNSCLMTLRTQTGLGTSLQAALCSALLQLAQGCPLLKHTIFHTDFPSHSVFASGLIHEISLALRCLSSQDFVPFVLYCHRLSEPVSESEIPKVTWYTSL